MPGGAKLQTGERAAGAYAATLVAALIIANKGAWISGGGMGPHARLCSDHYGYDHGIVLTWAGAALLVTARAALGAGGNNEHRLFGT